MSRRELFMRIVGWTYFPMQFLTVWVLYFGFTLEPGILRLLDVFGVDEIILAVLEFVAILPFAAFTAEKFFIFLLLLIPYLVKILLATWRIWLFAFVTVQLVQYVVATCSVIARNAQTLNESATVIVKIGGPGSGKSSSAGYDAVLRAKKMWKKLQYDYWLYGGQADKWRTENNLEKLQEWYEIRDAYEFYASTDCCPCLWSNIPLGNLCGEKTNELTVEYLYQLKRLPAFSVLYIDEIGSMVDVELYRERPLDLSAMFRFCRHFGCFQIIATEQSAENVFIDARRVVAFNEYMLGQKWVCRPWLLIAIYNFFKWCFTKTQKGGKRFARAMAFLNSLIRHVGFRKYRFCYEGNTEREQSVYSNKRRTYYLPSALNYYYDERTYKNYYKAKDFPLEARVYGSMILQEESDAGVRYLRMQEARAAEERAARERAVQLVTRLLESPKTRDIALALGKESEAKKKLADRAQSDEELLKQLEDL